MFMGWGGVSNSATCNTATKTHNNNFSKREGLQGLEKEDKSETSAAVIPPPPGGWGWGRVCEWQEVTGGLVGGRRRG